eukprot:349691-Chlamydomonas_euryale.AAC.3
MHPLLRSRLPCIHCSAHGSHVSIGLSTYHSEPRIDACTLNAQLSLASPGRPPDWGGSQVNSQKKTELVFCTLCGVRNALGLKEPEDDNGGIGDEVVGSARSRGHLALLAASLLIGSDYHQDGAKVQCGGWELGARGGWLWSAGKVAAGCDIRNRGDWVPAGTRQHREAGRTALLTLRALKVPAPPSEVGGQLPESFCLDGHGERRRAEATCPAHLHPSYLLES